jgi:hypothetical protein
MGAGRDYFTCNELVRVSAYLGLALFRCGIRAYYKQPVTAHL